MKTKLALLSLAGLSFLASCKKDQNLSPDIESGETTTISTVNLMAEPEKQFEAKLAFAKALVKAMQEHRSLRELIKKTSLEMFNKDNEMLYLMIKDENLGDGLTVGKAISKHIEDQTLLTELENSYPSMTILVPTLPEKSFSPKIWNVDHTPAIAIKRSNSNNVPIIYSDGRESVIEGKYIPAFPVLVIKDNERIVHQDNKEFDKLKTRVFSSKNGTKFRFIGESFDPQTPEYQTTVDASGTREVMRNIRAFFVDQKLIDAYNTYQTQDGWQRDMVYYNISPNSPNGPFSYDFQEHVRSFTMVGDATVAYNKICDQTGDPSLIAVGFVNAPMWTEGSLEFKVKSLINAKNGIGEEKIGFFSAVASDLFHVVYTNHGMFYMVSDLWLKKKDVTLPIFNWNLDEYASTIKIEIEEVDVPETITQSESRTVKFATNFAIDVPSGQKVKVGMKFGTSLETTTTQTLQKSYTQGNDQLGEVIVNFADKFFTGTVDRVGLQRGLHYVTREYNSGWYSISVEPVRVQ